MKAKKMFSRVMIVLLLLVAMVCGTLSLGACGKKPTITLSQTAITIQVNKQVSLIATLSIEGEKVTWSSDDESIATVTDAGRVKGIKAGTTKIKASYKKVTAECEVTVVDAITVSLNKTELALNIGAEDTLVATVSNNEKPTWSSSDESIATVDTNGKVTGKAEGTATITADVQGSKASCDVTVSDPNREKIPQSAESDIQANDKMYYWTNCDMNQTPHRVVSENTYVLDFANNWAWYGVQLFYIKSGLTDNNNAVKFTLNTTAAGHITVNGKTFALEVGDNAIEIVKFGGEGKSTLSIQFGANNGNPPDIAAAVIKISNLTFEAYTPTKLETPTAIAVDAETKAITITDTNENKAEHYVVVLSQDGKKAYEAVIQNGGTITEGPMKNGTYTLSVYAYADGRYLSSDVFAPETAVEYEVTGGGSYNLQFKAEAAMTADEWFYWRESGEMSGEFKDNTLTVTFSGNGGNFYNMQLFYKETGTDRTAHNKFTFTVKSNKAGSIQVNGKVVTIPEDKVDTEIEVTVYAIGVNQADIIVLFCGENNAIDLTEGTVTFKFNSPVIEQYTPEPLATPTIVVNEDKTYTITDTNESKAGGYKLVYYKGEEKAGEATVTDKEGTLVVVPTLAAGEYTVKVVALGKDQYADSEASEGVAVTLAALTAPTIALGEENAFTITDTNEAVGGYTVNVYDESGKKVATVQTEDKTGTLDVDSLEAGKYTVKVLAKGTGVLLNSVESEGVELTKTGAASYDMAFAGETDTEVDSKYRIWYFDAAWGDPNSAVTMSKSTFNDGTITLEYECTKGGQDWFVQIFYKTDTLTKDTKYKLSFKVNVVNATKFTVNGKTTNLVAGDNEIFVVFTAGEYSKAGKATVSMQIAAYSNQDNKTNTVVISNIAYEEVVPEKLATPAIALGDEYAYTITDTNESKASKYTVAFYKEDGTKAGSQDFTEKTGTLVVSELASGKYTVKVKAVGGELYTDSDESEGVELNVVNESGVTYDMVLGNSGDDEWGNKGIEVDSKYYYWRDQWDWSKTANVNMTKAVYKDQQITLEYECTQGGADHAVQIFGKRSDLTKDAKYKLSFKINVTNATKITINSKTVELVAGNNDVFVVFVAKEYTQAGADLAFSMQIATYKDKDNKSNTVVISEIVYEAFTPAKLATPTVAIGENNAYTITDENESKATKYLLTYYLDGEKKDEKSVTAKTGTIVVSNTLAAGAYKLKVTAVGEELYLNSDESAEVDVTIAALTAPTIALGEDNAYTITDDTNTDVGGYVIKVYKDDTAVKTVNVEKTAKTGTLDVAALDAGTYSVKVLAKGVGQFVNSAESAGVELVKAGAANVKYDMEFGAEQTDQWNTGIAVDDKYHVWYANWDGNHVTMTKAEYDNGKMTLVFNTTEGGADYFVQVFYKTNTLTSGTRYKLSLKVKVATATKVGATVGNGGTNQSDKTSEVKNLTADTETLYEVEFTAGTYTQPGGATMSVQIATYADTETTEAGKSTASNTVVISDIVFTEVTDSAE